MNISKAQKIVSLFVVLILLSTAASSVIGSTNVNEIHIEGDNYAIEPEEDQNVQEDVNSESIVGGKVIASANSNEAKKSISMSSRIGNVIVDFLGKILDRFPRLSSIPLFNTLLKSFGITEDVGVSDDTGSDEEENDGTDVSADDGNQGEGDETEVEYCGDNLCNNDETCFSCPGDCGLCGNLETTDGEGEEEDGNDGNGVDGENIVVVPEAGHIALIGNGYMELNVTLGFNGSVFVTLIGSVYMSTGVNSIDIWWNLSTGFLEVNASASSGEENPFFQLEDFVIEIQANDGEENNTIRCYVGLLSADASAHLILSQGITEGSVGFDGIFEIQDFNVTASELSFENFTMAGSLNFSAGMTGDFLVSWNESQVFMDGGASASASAQLIVSNFYLNLDGIPITARMDYLSISEGRINLSMGNSLEVGVGATIVMEGFHLSSSFLSVGIGSLDTSFGIYVRTDLSTSILVGASGMLTMYDFSARVPGLGSVSTSYVDTNGSVYLSMSGGGSSFSVSASGYVIICSFQAYMTGVLSVGWDLLDANGSVGLSSNPSSFSIAADGSITINNFHLGLSGLSVHFSRLYATGGMHAYMGQYISVHADGCLTLCDLSVTVPGLFAHVGYIYAGGEVTVYIGDHFMVDAEGIVEISSVSVSGSISMTMGSLSAGVDVYLYVGSEVHATANGYLHINNFEFSGLGGWSTFKLSGDAKGDITGSEITVAGTSEGSGATVTLSITNGHFGILGISLITGTITLDGGGSAGFGGGSNTITFDASASASITGVVFNGFGLDFTLSSMVISGGGSGTIYVGEKMVGVESGTVSLNINEFVMNAPYDITIQSCSIEGGGDLTLQLTSETSIYFSGIGDVTGHVQINDALIQIGLSANVFGNANWADNLHLDASGSGHLKLHVEKSGGTMLDMDLVGSGGALSVDYSGNFGNEGQVQANTGGWSASVFLANRDEEYSLSLSGDVYVSYTVGSADGSLFASSSGGCSVDLGVKKGGSPKLLLNADIPAGGGGNVNVVYRGSSLPPDYCMVDLGLDAVISFTISRLKGSIGPGLAYLRWDRYADLGDRLTISGECAGSLFWNSGEWVQVWPWPWMEGEVSLEAKGPEGSWDKSISVDPGDNVNFKATVNQDGENNNENEQSEGSTDSYASFADENSGTGYTYDFFWGDATPGTTVTSDENCYVNHVYDEIGSYTAEVMVYDSADMLIGMDHVTIQVGDSLGVSLKCDKPILKLYSFGEMATFTATVDNGESNSGSSTENQNSGNQGGTTYTSYASGGFKYDYEFDFGGGDRRGATTVRTSCDMDDECDTAGEKTVKVTVTEKYVDTGEETGRVGSASCTIHISNGIKVLLIPSKLFPECGEEMSFTAKILKDDSEAESESTTQDQNSNNFGTLKYDPGDEKYSYIFNFGDGDTESESSDSKQVTVNHRYMVNGPKLVEVCVKNTETGSEGKAYAVVEVWGGLDVSLSASPKTPDKNVPVTFTATVDENSGSNSESTESQNTNQEANMYATFSSSGDSYSYVFEFDDGSSPDTTSGGTTSSTSHVYGNPGIYMAKVTVTGDGGASGVATTFVYVGGNGSIDISPEILDFGTLSPGETKTKSFSVYNNAESGSLDWHVSGKPSWAKCSPLSGFSIGSGESDSVSVTVTAPSGGNSNAESNAPESTESNNVNNMVMNFGSIQETESTTNSQASPTSTTGGTNTYDGTIQVSNQKDYSDKDSVYITFRVPKSSAVADAGMDMTIDATEAQSVDVVYNMVPSNYVNAEGQTVTVDDSYSVVANQDGTYNVQQNDVTVQEDLESSEAVQTYCNNNAQTGTTDIPGDDDTGDNNDDNDDDDSNSAPHISSISSKSVTEGNTLTVSVHASDADGDSLTFSVVQGPGSISGSSQSNSYSSFASSGQQSSYQTATYTYHAGQDSDCDDETKYVKIKVRDGHGGVDYESFNIYVNDDDSCDDDCCFPAGTLITMADGSFKVIEDVKVGELVLSYNTKDSELTTCKVLETVSPMRKGVYSINDGLVRPTDDHPFYTCKADGRTGWASIDPSHSISGYRMRVMSLEVGDEIFNSDGQWIKIESIEYQSGRIQTYNLEDVSGKSNFFANGMLVHNAVDCDSSNNNYMLSSSYSEPDEEQKESAGEIEEVIDITVQFDASGSYISTDSQVNNDVNDEYDDSVSGISNDSNEPNYIDEVISDDDLMSFSRTHSDNKISFSLNLEEFAVSDDKTGEGASSQPQQGETSAFYTFIQRLVDVFPFLAKIPFIGKILENIKSDEQAPVDNNQVDGDIELPGDSPDISDDSTDSGVYNDINNIDDVSNGEVYYIWDFGDGDVGYGINPIHTYHIAYSASSEIEDTFTNEFAPVGIPGDTALIDEPYEIGGVVDTDQVSSSGSVTKETFDYTITLIIVDESGDLLSFDRTTVSVEIPMSKQSQASSSQDSADSNYGDLHYKNIENVEVGDVVLSKTDLSQNPSSLSNDLVGAEVLSTVHNQAIEVVNYLVIEFEQSQVVADDGTFDSSSYILFDPLVIGDDPVMPADDSSSSIDPDDTPETDITALRVTTNQPIFVNGEFVPASEIKEGDILYTFSGKNAVVTSVTEQSAYVDTYNIGLEEHHNYFANGILVGGQTKSIADSTGSVQENGEIVSGFLSGTAIVLFTNPDNGVTDSSNPIDPHVDPGIPATDINSFHAQVLFNPF